MSGRTPHCSTANSVPVRPNPVATSSQIEQHVVARGTRRATARTNDRLVEHHAGGALHERLEHDGGQLVRVLVDQSRRRVGSRRRRARRPQHREPQRVEHVGAEPAVADRQRADRVAVVRAAEREVASCGR